MFFVSEGKLKFSHILRYVIVSYDLTKSKGHLAS